MCLWAIVPVKPLRRAHTRLSGILNSEEREQLNYELLRKTIQSLSQVEEIEKVLVVSSDASALALARDFNARTLLEDGHTQLNMALTRATALAVAYETSAVLVLPADLPFVTPDDLRLFVRAATGSRDVVIAPDRQETGTNGLLISPAGLIPYAFGENNFQRHLELARSAGARVEVIRSPAFALDIDTPEDFALYRQMEAEMKRQAASTA